MIIRYITRQKFEHYRNSTCISHPRLNSLASSLTILWNQKNTHNFSQKTTSPFLAFITHQFLSKIRGFSFGNRSHSTLINYQSTRERTDHCGWLQSREFLQADQKITQSSDTIIKKVSGDGRIKNHYEFNKTNDN